MKKVVLISLAVLLFLTLSACSLWSGGIPLGTEQALSEETSKTEPGGTTTVPSSTGTVPTTESTTSGTKTTTKKSAGTTAKKKPSQNTTSKYEHSGTVHFSDSPDNLFIKAVVNAYGADPALLAAIYYVPQNDANTVLQFDGSKNSDGTLIRNEHTLKYIYTVDASYTVLQRASENPLENKGCKTTESMVMFYSVRKWLIPEFENELS